MQVLVQNKTSTCNPVPKVTSTFGIACAITCGVTFYTTHVYQGFQPHYWC